MTTPLVKTLSLGKQSRTSYPQRITRVRRPGIFLVRQFSDKPQNGIPKESHTSGPQANTSSGIRTFTIAVLLIGVIAADAAFTYHLANTLQANMDQLQEMQANMAQLQETVNTLQASMDDQGQNILELDEVQYKNATRMNWLERSFSRFTRLGGLINLATGVFLYLFFDGWI